MMICTWCDNKLTDEEQEAPRRDTDGDPLCDHCYNDEYLFTCIRCEGYGETSYRDSIGALFVAFDDTGIEPGVYEVIDHPIYADGITEQTLYKHAIRQLSGNTFGIAEGDYPMAFLCEECAQEIRQKCQVNEPKASK